MDKDKLEKYVYDKAQEEGLLILEISYSPGNGSFINIVADSKGGITVEACAKFNRGIRSWIERNQLFSGGFTVDVSSPGLDRALKSDTDYTWAMGKQIVVNTDQPVSGCSRIVGELVDFNNGKDVSVNTGEQNVEIDISNIASAKLYLKT